MNCKNCHKSSVERELVSVEIIFLSRNFLSINFSLCIPQGEVICSNCGIIIERDNLHDNPTKEGTYFVNRDHISYHEQASTLPFRFRRTGLSAKSCSTVKGLISQARIIAANLKLSSSDITSLEILIQELLRHQIFIKRSIATKKILPAVIAYTLANKNGTVISMQCACGQVDCSLSDFKKVLKLFVLCKPDYKVKYKSLSEWLPYCLNQTIFNEEEKRRVEQLSLKLLNLFTSVDLISINKQENFIIAVMYISWKAIDLEHRKKTNYRTFAVKSSLSINQTTQKYYNNLVNSIVELSYFLPWVSLDDDFVKKNHQLRYIHDILDNSTVVIERYKSNQEKKTGSPRIIAESSNLMALFGKELINKTLVMEEDEYISDSEIDSYIRKEEEINFVKKLTKNKTISSQ